MPAPEHFFVRGLIEIPVVDTGEVFELEPTGHPLAVEQRTGMTRARVQQIAETLLHPGP